MDVLKAIMAIVAAMQKVPNWSDKAAVTAWLNTLVDPVATLIVLIKGKEKLKAVELTDAEQEAFCLEATEALGKDGKFLELLKQLLPILIQIIPLFIKDDPKPAPTPVV